MRAGARVAVSAAGLALLLLSLPSSAGAAERRAEDPRSLLVFFEAQNRGELDPCG